MGTIDPLTFCISADSQWVVCGFVNLDKMNNLNNDSTKRNSMHLHS